MHIICKKCVPLHPREINNPSRLYTQCKQITTSSSWKGSTKALHSRNWPKRPVLPSVRSQKPNAASLSAQSLIVPSGTPWGLNNGIMEKYYIGLAQLLPDDERLEITYDRDTETINIFTDDVMIHGDTAARIYAYCANNALRCYISWSYVSCRICLGILKNI